jgi:hypothetical protein
MAIIVNGVKITDDEIYAEVQYHPSGSLEEAQYRASQALVIRELLLQESRGKGLLGPEETQSVEKVEEAIESLIEREVFVPHADEASCKRYYDQNAEKFVDKKTQEALPFEIVCSYIGDYLHACSLQMGIRHYIEFLSGRAEVVGFKLEGEGGQLVR